MAGRRTRRKVWPELVHHSKRGVKTTHPLLVTLRVGTWVGRPPRGRSEVLFGEKSTALAKKAKTGRVNLLFSSSSGVNTRGSRRRKELLFLSPSSSSHVGLCLLLLFLLRMHRSHHEPKDKQEEGNKEGEGEEASCSILRTRLCQPW